MPRTITDANFVESRLHSLSTRNAAAYKGVHALVLAHGARDWMYDQALDKVPYLSLHVDIHHVFPKKWCKAHDIDAERRESIVNKTPLSADTNRAIGGAAPADYLRVIERRAQIDDARLDELLTTHAIEPAALRTGDFDAYFVARRDALVTLVETAMGKPAQRDLDNGTPQETVDQFDATDIEVVPDADDVYVDEGDASGARFTVDEDDDTA